MSVADLVYVTGALLASVRIPSVPSLIALRGAGPRYREAILRSLIGGWAVAAFVGMWMGIGWGALLVGGHGWSLYRDLTIVLMGAGFAILPLAIRVGNRALRAAREVAPAHATEPPSAN